MLIFIFSILLLILSFFAKDIIISSVISTTNTFIFVLIPSLFLMIIITTLLSSNKIMIYLIRKIHPIFKHIFGFESEKETYIFFFSFLSGNPTVATMLSEATSDNEISNHEGDRLVKILCLSSPVYLFSQITAFSTKAKIVIIIANYLPILFYLFWSKTKTYSNNTALLVKECNLFEAINKSFSILLKIFSIILFFTILINMVFHYIHLNNIHKYMFANLLESTIGSQLQTNLNESSRLLMFLFFNSFLGISIHMQILSIYKINYVKFISFRVLLGFCVCIYGYLMYINYWFSLLILPILLIKGLRKFLILNSKLFSNSRINKKIYN